jgi:hypothetical protein
VVNHSGLSMKFGSGSLVSSRLWANEDEKDVMTNRIH